MSGMPRSVLGRRAAAERVQADDLRGRRFPGLLHPGGPGSGAGSSRTAVSAGTFASGSIGSKRSA